MLWSSKFASAGSDSGAVESWEISSRSATVSVGDATHPVVQASRAYCGQYACLRQMLGLDKP